MALAGAYVIVRQVQYHPLPDFAWVLVGDAAHGPGWLAVLLVVAVAVGSDDTESVRDSQSTQFQVTTSRTPGTDTIQRSRGQ